MKKIWILVCLLVLASCTTQPPKEVIRMSTPLPESVSVPAKAVPPPPPVVVRAPAAAADPQPTFGLVFRDYLYPKGEVTSGYANYLLLAKRPQNKEEKEHYTQLCEQWLGNFEDMREAPKVSSDVKVIPMYWMLKTPAKTEDCQELLKHYDYVRAQLYMIAKKMDITRSHLVCEIPSGLIQMDVTFLREPQQLSRAFDIWRRKMQVLPKKSETVRATDIASSAKAMFGALGFLIAMK